MKPPIHIKNPLVRGGTSQKQRKFVALDPKYVEIDERKEEDHIRFASGFSELIQFYNDSNQRDGNWASFFTEESKKDDPHFALFLSFLKLLQFATNDINEITARHLEFYYSDVLGLLKKNAKPDKAHIVFELAKNIETHLLERGTLLSAGKDALGVERIYRTEEELVVNKTEIAEARSVYFDPESSRLYKEFHSIENGDPWRPFGSKSLRSKPDAEVDIGFAISSPMLLLSEGTRSVTITISLSQKLPNDLNINSTEKDFLVYFSGEKDWIGPFEVNAEVTARNKFFIKIEIPIETEPITVFSPKNLSGKFDIAQPVAKVLLNNSSRHLTYDILRNSNIDTYTIEVEAKGMKNLVVQNDLTVLDPNKPFQPFGPRPNPGSNFYVGNSEAFQKDVEKLQVCFNWLNPPNDFQAYYREYIHNGETISEKDFRAEVALLYNKKWHPVYVSQSRIGKKEINSEIQLFAGSTEKTAAKLEEKDDLWICDTSNDLILEEPFLSKKSELAEIEKLPELNIGRQFSIDSKAGFIKFSLKNSHHFSAFGHDAFPRLYASSLIQKVKKDSTPLPNEPYTPVINDVSLTYKASQTVLLTRGIDDADEGKRYDKYYHIGPYGETEKEPLMLGEEDRLRTPFLDPFNSDGTFYLAFTEMKPNQIISILFQVEEGSADPALIGKIKLEWSYLSSNTWQLFDQKSILADSTQLLIRPGVIKMKVPESITKDNTILPSDLYWIRATVSPTESEKELSASSVDGIGRILSMNTQVVSASFVDQGNDPDHLRVSLPAKKINKLQTKDAAIKSILQPYPSFQGKMAEREEEFNTRASERLRHKSRGITIWDYERLVLEKFPSVYKVRCLNHTGRNFEFSPGSVTVIVISNLRNQHAINQLEPVTSISVLSDIIDFLKPRISPFINLEVKNPDFEKIQLHFDVKFHEGYDEGFYLQKLDTDIQHFLSPWAFDEGQDLSFEGSIHRSTILNYVEELTYVDFATCFKMDHLVNSDTIYKDVDEAIATSSTAILVSVMDHDIQLLRNENCSCEDRVELLPPPDSGIGAMMVDFDFKVL